MNVLAIDTALSGCSAGFYRAGGGCAAEQQAMARGQSEALVPMVQRVIEKAGAVPADIDLIVTTVGPGAFTGLRIGMATAQGFGIALGKPVCGVTTLEVLAAMFFAADRLDPDELLGILIETKRQDFYCQFFRPDGSAETEPQAWSSERLREYQQGKAIVWIGDAVGRYMPESGRVAEGFDLPDPCVIAETGATLYQAGKARAVEPLYLRDADVSVSKKQQREILDPLV